MGHADTSKLDIYSKWIDDWRGENAVAYGYRKEMKGKSIEA